MGGKEGPGVIQGGGFVLGAVGSIKQKKGEQRTYEMAIPEEGIQGGGKVQMFPGGGEEFSLSSSSSTLGGASALPKGTQPPHLKVWEEGGG